MYYEDQIRHWYNGPMEFLPWKIYDALPRLY
jgi:hypothetical protein